MGTVWWKNYDNMLSRFHLIPERHGQTDGQTDGRTDKIAILIPRVSVLTHDKNWTMHICLLRVRAVQYRFCIVIEFAQH